MGCEDTDWNTESQRELLLLSARPPNPGGEKAWVVLTQVGLSLNRERAGLGPEPTQVMGFTFIVFTFMVSLISGKEGGLNHW